MTKTTDHNEDDLRKWIKNSDQYHYVRMVTENWVCPNSEKTPHGIITKENLMSLNNFFSTPLHARNDTSLATIRTYTPWNLSHLKWKRPLPLLTTKKSRKTSYVMAGKFKSRAGTPNYKIKTRHRPINIHYRILYDSVHLNTHTYSYIAQNRRI